MDNDNKDITAIFAKNLNQLIENSGKSIYQISKDTNIAHSYIYALCKQNKKNPSMSIIKKLADYFEVSPHDFYKT